MHATAPHPIPALPPQMSPATELARASIEQFLEAFASPQADQSDFRLRVRCASGVSDCATEDLWLGELDLSSNPASGAIADESSLPGLSHPERVCFEPEQVSDWRYTEAGQLVGAFTSRLIRFEAPEPTSRFTLLRELWML